MDIAQKRSRVAYDIVKVNIHLDQCVLIAETRLASRTPSAGHLS